MKVHMVSGYWLEVDFSGTRVTDGMCKTYKLSDRVPGHGKVINVVADWLIANKGLIATLPDWELESLRKFVLETSRPIKEGVRNN